MSIAQVRTATTYTERVEGIHRLAGLALPLLAADVAGEIDKAMDEFEPFSWEAHTMMNKDNLVVSEIRLARQSRGQLTVSEERLLPTVASLREDYSRSSYEGGLARIYGRIVHELATIGIIPTESETLIMKTVFEEDADAGG